MGNWYVNSVVKGVDKKRIGEFLNASGRRAVVLPSTAGHTVVCDEASESFDERDSRRFNMELTKVLQCRAATFMNADDDLLSYRLYDKGSLVDEYYSSVDVYEPRDPSVFVSDNNRAHAERLGAFFSCSDLRKLEKILSSEYVFAVERHAELEQELGFKNSAGMGYKYASRGEFAEAITDVLVTSE